MEFKSFGKIPRYSRECVITEKIDGTNASVWIIDSWDAIFGCDRPLKELEVAQVIEPALLKRWVIFAGSRKRFITPENDNYGFAKWVKDNAKELVFLGEGVHYGEWWGLGIQRKYGIAEKRFSLFNTHRWAENRPGCCSVVPVIDKGPFGTAMVEAAMSSLEDVGSLASPGFMRPEGIVIYHTAGNVLFKKTFKDDEGGKNELS